MPVGHWDTALMIGPYVMVCNSISRATGVRSRLNLPLRVLRTVAFSGEKPITGLLRRLLISLMALRPVVVLRLGSTSNPLTDLATERREDAAVRLGRLDLK